MLIYIYIYKGKTCYGPRTPTTAVSLSRLHVLWHLICSIVSCPMEMLSVIIIVVGNRVGNTSSKSSTKQLVFHFILMPLIMAWIHNTPHPPKNGLILHAARGEVYRQIYKYFDVEQFFFFCWEIKCQYIYMCVCYIVIYSIITTQ